MSPAKGNDPDHNVVNEPPRLFAEAVDLASRALGGSVIAASDELFAEKEHVIKPEPAESWSHLKGNRGVVYDGWETRRRRKELGHDWIIVRLGLPGVIRGVTVDTAFFRGNYPDMISVEACALEEYAWIDDVTDPGIAWIELVPPSRCHGDCENSYEVNAEWRFTHVRLNIYPDGGVARFRVYGEAVPDPRYFEDISLDLAAIENGGLVTGQSDKFYRSAENLNATEKGWETRRRRTGGNDWFTVRLAGAGVVRQIWVDTTGFIGNAPEAIAIEGHNAEAGKTDNGGVWREVMPATPIAPDTKHRFIMKEAEQVTHLRFNIFPDGGLKRINVLGFLSAEGRSDLVLRWFNRLPDQLLRKLLSNLPVRETVADLVQSLRPVSNHTGMERALKELDNRCTADEARAIRRLLLLPQGD